MSRGTEVFFLNVSSQTNTLKKWTDIFFFATNGCGDYYCYRVSENGEVDTSGIYIWEHEEFETHYVAKDIRDAIIKYYNDEI